ncbi:MAG: type II toxin-antitoxin system RelB/DinJ family antitoxin [Bifidobacteriaceae bacterium]|nr:type II toxin-antitoxin system RelB/DinJ family antitoxin [Bifidobacteriaceae bacterium]
MGQTKTERINARIDGELKRDSEAVLEALGINLSEAITVFLRRVVAVRGIPFPLVVERSEMLGDSGQALESRAQAAVQAAIDARTAQGLPVARWDPDKGQPFLEMADGTREY